jgi:putative tryptophan/tyrosine transport system substrate-binding protein
MRDFNRRAVIALAGGAAAWPVATRAQRDAVPLVGFVRITSAEGFEDLLSAVRLGLKDTGFVDGQNVQVEARWADGRIERIPSIIREFVSLRAAAIVGNSTATAAGRTAAGDTPIVFVAGDDPVKAGHVASLNRPGGTITGVSFYDVPLAGKRLGLLLDLVPASASIAVLVDPVFAPFEEELTSLEAAALPIKRQLTIFRAANEAEIEAAFTAIAKSGAGGVHVGSGPTFNTHRKKIVTLAAQHKLPASYSLRGFADFGGLMSYGASQLDAYRRAGVYTGRILKGEKPGQLPVELPTKFELVLNLKTAKSLGLTVPNSFALLADEVIE